MPFGLFLFLLFLQDMKPLFFLAALVFSFSMQAQLDSSAPFVRNPILPPFELQQVNNSTLTKDMLEKKHRTMLMYFSPTCDHCKHQMKDIIAGMDSLKDVQIIMATYQPFEEMKQFYETFEIAKYKNIRMGRDTKYFFPPYYRMKNMPYLALYNKNGALITTYEGNHPIATLVKAFEEGKKKP